MLKVLVFSNLRMKTIIYITVSLQRTTCCLKILKEKNVNYHPTKFYLPMVV